jgi:hypothetical protein
MLFDWGDRRKKENRKYWRKKTGNIGERIKIHARGTRKRAIRNKTGKKNISK